MDNYELLLLQYAHLYENIHCNLGIPDHHNLLKNEDVVTTILRQHHVSKGLKIFGKKGSDAVLTEIKQLHDRMVIDPKHSRQLTKKEKKAALQYLLQSKRVAEN